MSFEIQHPLADQLENLDTEMGSLSGQIAQLEERVRKGDKGAFKTAKFHRAQLLKLRQERTELEKRLRRSAARGLGCPQGGVR